ncbi:DUF2878 domain-containing protein [Idiomarina sp. PL1-037]|uniref:DUF2878 domain-containing protein n=1 Tax=Idiomarina TaxID=135575 RepID=UPI00294AF02B|nr:MULTISPECIES: DUF2878 domain-containing protein [unclassified Idiomarina]MDV6327032.1 DUF2878 domain-containing protein [Idiomarina sp. Sol25]WQC51881.1 DUF2878 domain-containing protein [Idiomarina sp. PL1-037]
MTSIQHKIVSFVLFNALWFSAVSGRENYIVLSGVLLAFQFFYSIAVAKVSWTLILRLFAVGLLLEAIVISLGVIDFSGGYFPLWLVMLWLGFSSMAPVALDWLAPKPVIAVLLGAISGPLSYVAGIKLNAATIDSMPVVVGCYAAVWGLMMAYFVFSMSIKKEQGV